MSTLKQLLGASTQVTGTLPGATGGGTYAGRSSDTATYQLAAYRSGRAAYYMYSSLYTSSRRSNLSTYVSLGIGNTSMTTLLNITGTLDLDMVVIGARSTNTADQSLVVETLIDGAVIDQASFTIRYSAWAAIVPIGVCLSDTLDQGRFYGFVPQGPIRCNSSFQVRAQNTTGGGGISFRTSVFGRSVA